MTPEVPGDQKLRSASGRWRSARRSSRGRIDRRGSPAHRGSTARDRAGVEAERQVAELGEELLQAQRRARRDRPVARWSCPRLAADQPHAAGQRDRHRRPEPVAVALGPEHDRVAVERCQVPGVAGETGGRRRARAPAHGLVEGQRDRRRGQICVPGAGVATALAAAPVGNQLTTAAPRSPAQRSPRTRMSQTCRTVSQKLHQSMQPWHLPTPGHSPWRSSLR